MHDFDSVDRTETQTKLVKVIEEFEGRDVRIERVWVIKLLVLHLVDNFRDEVFALRVGCVIECMVVLLGLVLPLRLVYFRPRCILLDRVSV